MLVQLIIYCTQLLTSKFAGFCTYPLSEEGFKAVLGPERFGHGCHIPYVHCSILLCKDFISRILPSWESFVSGDRLQGLQAVTAMGISLRICAPDS